MSSGVVEASAISASSSIFLYGIMSLIKRWRNRKTKVEGLVLVKGKTYLQTNLTCEDVIFYDIDNVLSPSVPLFNIEKNDLRINYFPRARPLLKRVKEDHPNKRIVVVSCDAELLRYLRVKRVVGVLPSASMAQNVLRDIVGAGFDLLEKCRLTQSLSIPKDKQIIVENWADITKAVKDIYKLKETLF
jgi:hypothetical protein